MSSASLALATGISVERLVTSGRHAIHPHPARLPRCGIGHINPPILDRFADYSQPAGGSAQLRGGRLELFSMQPHAMDCLAHGVEDLQRVPDAKAGGILSH